jgi:hypothetical protein
MTQRIARAPGLTLRQRLALFHGTLVSTEDAIGMADSEIDVGFMARSQCKVVNLVAAELGPAALRARGCENANELRRVGFNSEHLCAPSTLNEAILAFGASSVVDEFLVSPRDAVFFADPEVVRLLAITPERLLRVCAAAPVEADAVLAQLTPGTALKDVSAKTLLDAGVRATGLKRYGYGLSAVVAAVAPTGSELCALGYTL